MGADDYFDFSDAFDQMDFGAYDDFQAGRRRSSIRGVPTTQFVRPQWTQPATNDMMRLKTPFPLRQWASAVDYLSKLKRKYPEDFAKIQYKDLRYSDGKVKIDGSWFSLRDCERAVKADRTRKKEMANTARYFEQKDLVLEVDLGAAELRVLAQYMNLDEIHSWREHSVSFKGTPKTEKCMHDSSLTTKVTQESPYTIKEHWKMARVNKIKAVTIGRTVSANYQSRKFEVTFEVGEEDDAIEVAEFGKAYVDRALGVGGRLAREERIKLNKFGRTYFNDDAFDIEDVVDTVK